MRTIIKNILLGIVVIFFVPIYALFVFLDWLFDNLERMTGKIKNQIEKTGNGIADYIKYPK